MAAARATVGRVSGVGDPGTGAVRCLFNLPRLKTRRDESSAAVKEGI